METTGFMKPFFAGWSGRDESPALWTYTLFTAEEKVVWQVSGAYRKLSAKTAVIADLDLLKRPGEFEGAITALRGDMEKLRPCYNIACSALAGLPPITSAKEFTRKHGNDPSKPAAAVC